MKIKQFRSLKTEAILAIIIAFALGAITFGVIYGTSDVLISKVYLDDARYEKRVEKDVFRLQKYVDENNVSSTDVSALEKYFTMTKNRSQYFMFYRDGYLRLVIDGKNSYEYQEGEIEKDETDPDYKIDFSDGTYFITIMDYSELEISTFINIFAIALTALVIFGVILVFNKIIINRIHKLALKVEEIATTNISEPLETNSVDEIGRLTSNIEEMRSSIIYHYEKEKESQQINRELITNMSHDLRTPLTAVIGYNEVIANEQTDNELIKQCAQLSLDKAYQLKEMSDKLFKYFLVYDKNKDFDVDIQTVSADILLPQIIGEQTSSLRQQGFNIVPDDRLEHVEIETDTLMVKRVFDNVFSNITKYADKNKPIDIAIYQRQDEIFVEIVDYVTENINAPSSGVGLRSCARIMEILGGRFSTQRDDDKFITTIVLKITNTNRD